MTKYTLFFLCALLSPLQAAPILHTLQGETIPFEQLKGKWIFINYWASWCEPCLAEIETFNRFYQHPNVALFAINMEGLSPLKQAQLAKDYHLTYPSLLDDSAHPLLAGELNAIPATLIFNPQGEFQEIRYGTQSARSLNAIIRQSS